MKKKIMISTVLFFVVAVGVALPMADVLPGMSYIASDVLPGMSPRP